MLVLQVFGKEVLNCVLSDPRASNLQEAARSCWLANTKRICTYWLSGGPDGKIFGSRSGRTDRAQSWQRAKYFPVRPNLTQSISILSYDHLLLKILKILFDPKRSDGHTCILKVSTTKICHLFFALNKELTCTIHWKNRLIFSFLFHAKKPTESWHKAVKNMSKPSKT